MRHAKLIAAGSAALLLISACASTTEPDTPTGTDTAIEEAQDSANRQTSNPALALRRQLDLATELNSASFQPGRTEEEFLKYRSDLTEVLETVAAACEPAPPTPEQGAQCTMAIAMRQTNDSAKFARTFQTAVASEDWAGVVTASNGLQSEIESTWTRYQRTVANLPSADQDKAPYFDMRLRTACVAQRSQAATNLRYQDTDTSPGRDALIAYLGAAAAAADHLNLVDAAATTCASGEDGIMCRAQKERTLGNACDRFS